jgi:hypothetical protein
MSATAGQPGLVEAGGGGGRGDQSRSGALRVGRHTDLAAVAAAAQHTGEIISFAYQPPMLSELFRQAVAA